MSFFGSGEWAVIKSGQDDKIKSIKLSDWEEYEWDDFAVLKDTDENQIQWFEDEEKAIDFIFENFDESLISQKLLLERKIPSDYYFD